MRRLWILAVVTAVAPALASAEGFRHGRLRFVEDGVSIQRGVETGTEEAAANMPFLPGDRVWTGGHGRVEFQFAAGSILRLDSGSKLDYVAHEEDRDEQVALRLWSGALYMHTRDERDPAFEIETPGGVIRTRGRSVVRIDVQGGEARVSVYEGEATLEGGRGVRLRAGQRVYAQRGEVVDGPESFDRADGDEFASWDQDRHERTAYAANRRSNLPEDVAPYADELEANGSWYYQQEVGHVWRPYVGAGWQPYSNGRWIWTVYGWTWVPSEPWGWAPSHFGRWGFAPALGWYWIPGRTWGPAWVSWALGGDYVGWCPLGYRDRPVLVYGSRGGSGRRGHAVPRGSVASGVDGSRVSTVASAPWIYTRRGDVASRDLARRRVQPAGTAIPHIRVLEGTQTRLTRNLTLADAVSSDGARPRSVRTRPTMSDSVPEMRADPMTTIPMTATPRRMPREPEANPSAGGDSSRVRALPAGDAFESGAASRRSRTGDQGTVRSRPADRPVRDGGVMARPRAPEGAGVVAAPPSRNESDREVLRPVFKSLGRPRDEGRGNDSAGARQRGGTDRGASGTFRSRSGDSGEPRSRGGEVRSRETQPTRERPRAEPPPRQAPPPPPSPRREESPARERSGAKRRGES